MAKTGKPAGEELAEVVSIATDAYVFGYTRWSLWT